MTLLQRTSIAPDSPVMVFGGPYSNLRATEAARREAKRLGIPASQCVCTGDVVAYCAEPEETVQVIRDWGCHVIAGNCEEQLATGADDCGCGFEEGTACDLLAKGWYPFANARVSDSTRAWMAGLPKTLDFACGRQRVRTIHGGTSMTNRFIFASDRDILNDEMKLADCDIVLAGHCGIPFIERLGLKIWFNPGVIGMPANDGTPDGWYGLMTPDVHGVRLSTHRLAYDSATAAAAMRRWSYADTYATSLVTGIWPSFDVLPPAERDATGKRLRPRRMTSQHEASPPGTVKSASSALL